MKLNPEQIVSALDKKLAPIYFISGDEPLQVLETADAVRKSAKQAGYQSREILSVDSRFSWSQLKLAADSFSVFSDKKVIDLRLPSGKPGTEGGKVLTAYCESPPADTLLLVTAGKIASASQRSRWYQALEKVGVVVQVWPLEGRNLVSWLQRRIKHRGIQIEQEGVKILASRVEGNLLAAAQEIEKLYVLYGAKRLTAQQVQEAVSDSSRFDVYKLVDSALSGQTLRVTRILKGLMSEGVAAPVVLWALTRDARLLLKLRTLIEGGQTKSSAFKQCQVWDNRKNLVNLALDRVKESALNQALLLGAKTDRQIKGEQSGDPWETLLMICLLFSTDDFLQWSFSRDA